MGDIFLKLLNMSITAGWLVLVVLAVRLLFRKMPRWICCLLWGVVDIRLLAPFSIESALSLQPSAEPIQSVTVVEGEIMPVPSIDSKLSFVETQVNPVLRDTFAYQKTEGVAPLQVVTEVAGGIWLVGMLLFIVVAMVGTIRLHLLVREAICCRENVSLCDAVTSPFILGIIRPKIYLPSTLAEGEMGYILAHEKAHLKRGDHLWKPIGYLILCVYWFHPLCWIAYILLCRDIELACDEKVIRDMSFEDKKEYSRVLLSCATQRRYVLTCPLAFGEVGVKVRVKSVLTHKKAAVGISILAILVCIVIAVCFLTNPAKEYQIRITIPAGNTYDFCYSEEEISPKRHTLTIANGSGLGDTEVILLPVEVKEENAYDDVPLWRTCILNCGYDTGHMELISEEKNNSLWSEEKQKDVSSGKKHEEDFYEAMKESRYDSAMHFMSMYIKMVKGRDAAGIAALSDKEYSEREQELLDSKENEWMRYATAEFYDEKKTGEFTMKIMSADRAIIRYVDVIIRKDEESGKTYFVAEDIRE